MLPSHSPQPGFSISRKQGIVLSDEQSLALTPATPDLQNAFENEDSLDGDDVPFSQETTNLRREVSEEMGSCTTTD